MSFTVTILGSASAKPTPGRHPSAQVVNLHEQHYLVDAGEGTQQQLFRYGINPLRLRAVFLSHLHGDHCFGLFPLLSTLGLYGRRTPLPVYAPAPFGEILACHLRYFDSELPYAVEWHEVDTTCHRPLLENRSLEVWSIPLRHRVPTCGYLFREKEPPLNVDKFKITKYGLSIAQITAAKRGEAVRPLQGAVVRLPVGHGLLGQGGGAGRRRRPALPRGDLRCRRAEDRPRAGTLHDGRSRTGSPPRRGRTARDRPLLVALQGARSAARRGADALPRKRSGRGGAHLHDRKTTFQMLTKADIRLVRSLADKRARTDEGLFVAEGGKLIGELRASTLRIRRIYALDGVFAGEDVTTVSPKEMERLSLLKTPSDSLALVEIPRRRLDPAKLRRSLVLALDDVQNPGNLGTIVRLADWFGIGDVVCSEATADCFNPKVVQATMGAILRVRVHYCDLEAYLAAERAAGTPIYGTFLEGDDIYRTQLSPTGIVLMGNEGRGVTPACAAQVTRKLFIPPYPAERHATESLNVAMATGIVCAEFRRQASAGR